MPVYCNEANVPTSVPALAKVCQRIAGDSFEIICVEDGSRDRSFDVLTELQANPALRLRIVKLTRNFGSMSAIQAGLHQARGRAVGMITADEQDPAELLETMHEHWKAGAKCIYAVRTNREEGLATKLWANTFYFLLRRYALPGYPPGGFDFYLIDRQVVDELVAINEKNTNIMNLIFWLGYPAVSLPYTRRARVHGKSQWTLTKKIKLFVDSFVGFSFAPVRMVSIMGLVLFGLAVIYGGIQIYIRLVFGTPVQGFTTIVALIALTSGIQMMMLGIIGEYLWRALDAARSRPGFVVDKIQEPRHE